MSAIKSRLQTERDRFRRSRNSPKENLLNGNTIVYICEHFSRCYSCSFVEEFRRIQNAFTATNRAIQRTGKLQALKLVLHALDLGRLF